MKNIRHIFTHNGYSKLYVLPEAASDIFLLSTVSVQSSSPTFHNQPHFSYNFEIKHFNTSCSSLRKGLGQQNCSFQYRRATKWENTRPAKAKHKTSLVLREAPHLKCWESFSLTRNEVSTSNTKQSNCLQVIPTAITAPCNPVILEHQQLKAHHQTI